MFPKDTAYLFLIAYIGLYKVIAIRKFPLNIGQTLRITGINREANPEGALLHRTPAIALVLAPHL